MWPISADTLAYFYKLSGILQLVVISTESSLPVTKNAQPFKIPNLLNFFKVSSLFSKSALEKNTAFSKNIAKMGDIGG